MAEKKASKSTGKKDKKDPKELFRQALERKKQQHGHGSAGDKGDNQEHGKPDTHAHSNKREFRRKAGG